MFNNLYSWRQKRFLALLGIAWVVLTMLATTKINQVWFEGGVPTGTRVVSANLSSISVNQPVVISLTGIQMVGYNPYQLTDAALPGIGKHGLALPSLMGIPSSMAFLLIGVFFGILACVSGSALAAALALFTVWIASNQAALSINNMSASLANSPVLTSSGASVAFASILSFTILVAFTALVLTGFVKIKRLAKTASNTLKDVSVDTKLGKFSLSGKNLSISK